MSGLLVPERDLGRITSGALASGPEVSRILAGIVVKMELIFSSSWSSVLLEEVDIWAGLLIRLVSSLKGSETPLRQGLTRDSWERPLELAVGLVGLFGTESDIGVVLRPPSSSFR